MSGRLSAQSILLLAAAILVFGTACARKPQTIAPGAEKCEHCRMMIHDMRFHAQAFNEHGKLRHFDSIECAMLYRQTAAEKLSAVYAADYLHPGSYLRLVDGEGAPAVIVHSAKIHSPMGAGLAAVRAEDAEGFRIRTTGEVLDLAALEKYLRAQSEPVR